MLMIRNIKHLIATALLAMTSAAAWADVEPQAPTVGNGSEANPYELATVENMLWFKQQFEVDNNFRYSHFCLADDIDLTGIEWSTLGRDRDLTFGGTLDGHGHSIKGLTINSSSSAAFFYGMRSATLRNLTFENVSITSTGATASAIAISYVYGEPSTIENVRVTGAITSTSSRVAAFAPDVFYGIMTDCVNEATITSGYDGAGFVGRLDGTINRCVNKGNVSTNGSAAGIVNGPNPNAVISNCLNTGEIKSALSSASPGGIMCCNNSDQGITVSNCLNLGHIRTSGSAAGHIVGSSWMGGTIPPGFTLENNRWSETALLTKYDGTPLSKQDAVIGSIHPASIYVLRDNGVVTADDLASGKAAFILQGNQATTQWGQDLAAHQAYPEPSTANHVYADGDIDCIGNFLGTHFSNTSGSGTILDHAWTQGYCTRCGSSEAITPNASGIYEIGNAGQLLSFARLTASVSSATHNAVLTADIDMSIVCHPADPAHGIEALNWEGIGYVASPGSNSWGYKGTFDGQGHTLTGLYFDGMESGGLFRHIYSGTVRDLKLADVNCNTTTRVSNNYSTGALCGAINSNGPTVISGVTVLSGRVCGDYETGGLIGSIRNGAGNCHIIGCANYATVDGYVQDLGGIVGKIQTDNVRIEDCLNAGDVTFHGTNTYSYAGGIVGRPEYRKNCFISHCLNLGDVTAGLDTEYCGLIHGEDNDLCYVTACYAAGKLIVNGQEQSSNPFFKGSAAIPLTGTVICESASDADLRSGKVAFRLQDGRDDLTYWGQDLSVSQPHPVPAATHEVHFTGHVACNGIPSAGSYTNDLVAPVYDAHDFSAMGFCNACHQPEVPALSADVYQITNVGNLVWLARKTELNEVFNAALANDIDLKAYCEANGSWTPIGLSTSTAYAGTFDGRGHTIKGLYIDAACDNSALFGKISGTVCNLTVSGNVENPKNYNQALIVAVNDKGHVENCKTYGTVAGLYNVGGVVGTNYGTIKGCENHADVTCASLYDEQNVGGICAIVSGGTITECANYGNISGTKYNVGGIVGKSNYGPDKINYVANYGNITANRNAGGIVGYCITSNLHHAFVSGSITVKEATFVGHIAGYAGNESGFSDLYYERDMKVNAEVGEVAHQSYSTRATASDLLSGETAYILGVPFGQTLGFDKMPRLGAPQVYRGKYRHAVNEVLDEGRYVYSNNILTEDFEDHNFSCGVCTICGKHNGEVYTKTEKNLPNWVSTNQNQNATTSTSDKVLYDLGSVLNGCQLSFDWRVSSENSYDMFYAAVCNYDDDSEVERLVNAVSGEASGKVSYTFTAVGHYYLKLWYTKDSSQANGADTAWAEHIRYTGLTYIPSKVWGDVDGNGTFDLDDVNAIREMALHPTTAHTNADLNGDGRVTIGDIAEGIHQLIMP